MSPATRLLALAGLTAALAAAGPRADAASLRVVASGLDQPKKISIAPSGDLVVALSGDGDAPSSCTTGRQASCGDRSGAVVDVSPAGTVTTVRSGLSSVASDAGKGQQATGPVDAVVDGSTLRVLFQSSFINLTTGREVFGPIGSELGGLYASSGTSLTRSADFSRFEARHDPDKGEGTEVAYGENAVNSDPYAMVPYDGGFAVADAGGNDVLTVSAGGAVHVLAVLPTIRERAAAGTFSSAQKKAIEAQAQPVPDALAVGPDGALYVGELGGSPFKVGASRVYKLVPGHAPQLVATDLTAIDDLAFDAQGRLLVLELDAKGLTDPGFQKGRPASGRVIRIAPDGSRTTLVGSGLSSPTGLAVGHDGTIYVADHGTSTGKGQILAVTP